MKSLFSLTAIVVGLVFLEQVFICADSFTDGVRVSPDQETSLHPGFSSQS